MSKTLIIDVRTAEEYKGGHVKGAKNIPLSQIPFSLEQIGAKDQEIIVYCQSGMRSHSASILLEKNGFSNVSNGGGIGQMLSSGYERE